MSPVRFWVSPPPKNFGILRLGNFTNLNIPAVLIKRGPAVEQVRAGLDIFNKVHPSNLLGSGHIAKVRVPAIDTTQRAV